MYQTRSRIHKFIGIYDEKGLLDQEKTKEVGFDDSVKTIQ